MSGADERPLGLSLDGTATEEVELCGYLTICVGPGGRVQLQGSPAALQAFLETCAAAGIVLDFEYLSWCG